jgi:pimeloyl-ACP methyl ester carboxylesterase
VLKEFRIDRYELTNRKFKEFIDAGGYQKREYWKYPIVRDGKKMEWDEAMALFRDPTGRPGPSTWEVGTFAKGQEEFPVNGVSWYEAAAYCEFAGKNLPTIYHWDKAAKQAVPVEIARMSNFRSDGPAAVGFGLGPFGIYDMAGNVEEWAWNESGGMRYILGGAWGQPAYFFSGKNRMPPLDRAKTHGFRCVKYSEPPSDEALAPVESVTRDYTKEKPVGDEAFQLIRNMYAYDRGPLNAKVERIDDSSEHWRREKITYDAAYGGQRMLAWLYLPKGSRAPYQTVVYFPGSDALDAGSSEQTMGEPIFDFVVRSGRAVFHPVYQDMYERRVTGAARGPNFNRERTIQWSKDLGRSIDYLETRSDIDRNKLALEGLSLGATAGPIVMALEGRLKASVLIAGGFPIQTRPAELDLINFAPRTKIPVLMINGRNDHFFPYESSQLPMFRFLGAPPQDKRHAVHDAGHMPPRNEIIKETLNWLDKYLGPVK